MRFFIQPARESCDAFVFFIFALVINAYIAFRHTDKKLNPETFGKLCSRLISKTQREDAATAKAEMAWRASK